jgi:hypothetical protein
LAEATALLNSSIEVFEQLEAQLDLTAAHDLQHEMTPAV